MKRRVVVTGLGLVTPVGNSVEESWRALVAGTSGAARIAHFDPAKLDTRFACEVKGFDPLAWMDRKEAKRMDGFCHYAMAATQQAVQDAGLAGGFPDPKTTGVIIASGIGGIQTFEEQCNIYLTKGPGRVSPFFVPMYIPNMAAGLVSMKYGLQGPNYCTVSACASSAHAIGEAFRLIEDGDTEMMIAGGAEAAITGLAMAGFGNMKALSTRNESPETASRPFDKDRDGFIMGEGAAILILEELERARNRGAKIYAEMVGYGASADAHHVTAPAPGGEGAVRAMTAALADAKVPASAVDYINAHGTSTPYNDLYETMAIKTVFGDRAKSIAVSSTKSMTGHLLGAAGAIEGMFCSLALREGVIPPTMNYTTPDPECDLDYVPNAPRRQAIRYAMSNSFGFGGTNSVLLFGRFEV